MATLQREAFPLKLRYPDSGYHKVLITSLNKNSPLLKWSKKVAQWNSKLNRFCYLKLFTHISRATIANVLGPFPSGKQLERFANFCHTSTQNLVTKTVGHRKYHFRWSHERPLGTQYKGRFDGKGLYGGKQSSYDELRAQVVKALQNHTIPFTKRLGLLQTWLKVKTLIQQKAATPKPSNSPN